MEIYHSVEEINGQQFIKIIVNYPDEYEFSLEYNKLKENVKSVSEKIKEYLKENFSDLKNKTYILVLNGVIVGTFLIPSLQPVITPITNKNLTSAEEIDETIPNKNQNDNSKLQNYQLVNAQDNTQSVKTEQEQINPNLNNVVTNNNVNTTAKTNEPKSTSNTKASGQPTTTTADKINLKLSSGQAVELSIEDYVTNVVAAEMPPSFNTEAIKAQALAARTYAYKNQSKTISSTTSDQVYKTNDELKKSWGSSYTTYYNKIHNAVLATKGEYITYNGTYINAQYFSMSNGKTEDPVYVWGSSVPYLKPVDSHWDLNVSGFSSTKTIALTTLNSKLGVSVKSNSDIKILSKTSGDRVNKVSFSGKTFTGVDIRTKLGLRSADFDIKIVGSDAIFTTRGYGHGVGMSQYGANAMANEGYSYKQILTHYYSGITIQKK